MIKSVVIALVSTGLAQASSSATSSVVICKGPFAVRQSVCDSIPAAVKDVTPIESLDCSAAVAPNDFAALLKGTATWGKLDFASTATLKSTARSMRSRTTIQLSFGDCNSATNLPSLDANGDYLAIVILNNAGAINSLALNKATNSGSTRVSMRSTVWYFTLAQLVDGVARATLVDSFNSCQISAGYCTLPFNMDVSTKEGLVALNKYL